MARNGKMWKPNIHEKRQIRAAAAEKVGLTVGQITLDADVDNEFVEWAIFVRHGVNADNYKSVAFDIYEMVGFAAKRQRGGYAGQITAHIEPSRPRPVMVSVG